MAEKFPKIEIQVCESIDRSSSGHGAPPLYHVEVRIIPRKGAHSVCFQGQRYLNRIVAQTEYEQARKAFL